MTMQLLGEFSINFNDYFQSAFGKFDLIESKARNLQRSAA
jgi:hypothetical protein